MTEVTKYIVTKTCTISVGHVLSLGKAHPCSRPHGHNLRVTVCCSAYSLNKDGMVVDFNDIAGIIREYDHTTVGGTMEKFAGTLAERVNLLLNPEKELRIKNAHVLWVEVAETDGNVCRVELL